VSIITRIGQFTPKFQVKTHVRAVVAYVAGRLITGSTASSVYDYTEGNHRSIDGTVRIGHVAVYDYQNSCHFGGDGSAQELSLYHYGESCHISLVVKGRDFEGFDYGESCHYSGEIKGNSISLYDYGKSAYSHTHSE
jgi:hypothetical protein